MTKLSKRAGLLLAVVLLLAFWLRLFRIGYQSIWGDEAYSIWRSGLPLLEIPGQVAKTGDLAPFYYFILHFWQGLTGSSELAVRFLSLFFGILALPLAFKVMERLHSREAGLFAAVIGAVSPFWVYYAQETKMYAQMAFTVLLSTYLFLRIFESERSRSRWAYIAYGIACAAAVYTHYFAMFAILAQGAYLLTSRRLQSSLRPWLAAQAVALACFLPWAIFAGSGLAWAGSSVKRGSISLTDIGSQVLQAFAVGASLKGELVPWVLASALALVVLGFLAASNKARLYLLLGLALPILGVYAISFLPHQGWARYFMAASPAFYGLIAAGLAFLYRKHFMFAALTLLVVAPSGVSLANYYFDPQFARYDYRSQVQAISKSSSPQDGVIANGPEAFPAFFYYSDNRLPVYVLPSRRASNPFQVQAFLAGLKHSGLWLVKYMPPDFDGANAIEGWLRRNSYPLQTKWVENVTFTYFSLPQDNVLPEPGEWGPATFENGIKLLGYQARVLPWGDRSLLQVALLWQTDKKVEQPYTVFVHAVDGANRQVGQGDSEPVGGLSPTTTWKPGEPVLDRHGAALPPAFQKEGSRLEVGLYDLKSGKRLQVLDDEGQPGGTALVLPLP